MTDTQIEVLQVKDSWFTDAHPNPDHRPGLRYDPVQKTVKVFYPIGTIAEANVGDWLLLCNGLAIVISDAIYRRLSSDNTLTAWTDGTWVEGPARNADYARNDPDYLLTFHPDLLPAEQPGNEEAGIVA